MKIISLNTWGGRAGHKELLNFFEREKRDTDIFCLQEMWRAPCENLDGKMVGGKNLETNRILTDGIQKISTILSDYILYFHPHHGDHYGLMMFVKKGMPIVETGDVFVYKERGYSPEMGLDVGHHARNIQYVTLTCEGDKNLTICNFHGLWNGKGKTDTPERLVQSEKIVAFMQSLQGDSIIIGDFNLLPNIESIKILERAGFTNLVKENGITSTRTSFYTKAEKYADYAFVSKSVEVKSFRVLPDEVSDHAPLELSIK